MVLFPLVLTFTLVLSTAPRENFRPVAAEEMELVRQGVRHNEAKVRNARMSVHIDILRRDPRWSHSRVTKVEESYLREYGTDVPRFRHGGHWETEEGQMVRRYGAFFDGEKQCNVNYTPGEPGTVMAPRASILGNPSYTRSETPDQFSLLDTFGIDSDPKPLSARLAEESARLLGKQHYDGADCYVVEVMRDEDGRFKRVWLDPERGFSVVRTEGYTVRDGGDPHLYAVHEDIELKEVAPDTWFPTSGTHRWYTNRIFEGDDVKHGDWYEAKVERTVVDELEINLDLTKDDFSFELPEGTKVFDSRFDWGYTVGEAPSNRLQQELEAEAAVAAEDFEPLPPPIETQEAPSEVAAPSGAQPAQEESTKPKPAPRHDGAGSSIAWAGGLAGAVVLAAVVLAFRRRRNAQRPN